MSIRVGKSVFAANLQTETSGEKRISEEGISQGSGEREPSAKGSVSGPAMTSLLGLGLGLVFYAFVFLVPWSPLQRYFLGHPIAVTATALFWFAIAVLIAKCLAVAAQRNQLATIRDEDLLPPPTEASPANRWLEDNDAGHVARLWLKEITKLPSEIRASQLVVRLEELLTRQSQRGSAKHLADDLRELSARDADSAHDSLGLVRIIIWAIPMLGFLGTVIGITQTLGGLDFSNGSSAVENLKSGLYVAFDTTAIGLVLSVLAIFVQFPIERSEQRLLAVIDARVGHLLSARLPSDDASDNQTALIAELCRGVQAAVAESLENQARLWRETIDEAQQHWHSVNNDNANQIAKAIETSLVPALTNHAQTLTTSNSTIREEISDECNRWRATMEEARSLMYEANEDSASRFVKSLEAILPSSLQDHATALKDHAAAIDQTSQSSTDRFENQLHKWQEVFRDHSDALLVGQDSVVKQFEALAETQRGTESILALQQSLDANLQRLNATNDSIDRSISAAAGDGMADAMRFLARAVDVLAKRLPENDIRQEASRQAA